jgi:hypothetical protein
VAGVVEGVAEEVVEAVDGAEDVEVVKRNPVLGGGKIIKRM